MAVSAKGLFFAMAGAASVGGALVWMWSAPGAAQKDSARTFEATALNQQACLRRVRDSISSAPSDLRSCRSELSRVESDLDDCYKGRR
jgi:hypothetical protein